MLFINPVLIGFILDQNVVLRRKLGECGILKDLPQTLSWLAGHKFTLTSCFDSWSISIPKSIFGQQLVERTPKHIEDSASCSKEGSRVIAKRMKCDGSYDVWELLEVCSKTRKANCPE